MKPLSIAVAVTLLASSCGGQGRSEPQNTDAPTIPSTTVDSGEDVSEATSPPNSGAVSTTSTTLDTSDASDDGSDEASDAAYTEADIIATLINDATEGLFSDLESAATDTAFFEAAQKIAGELAPVRDVIESRSWTSTVEIGAPTLPMFITVSSNDRNYCVTLADSDVFAMVDDGACNITTEAAQQFEQVFTGVTDSDTDVNAEPGSTGTQSDVDTVGAWFEQYVAERVAIGDEITDAVIEAIPAALNEFGYFDIFYDLSTATVSIDGENGSGCVVVGESSVSYRQGTC